MSQEKEQRFAGFLCDLSQPFTLTPGIYPNTCAVVTTSDHYQMYGVGGLDLSVGNTSVAIKDMYVIGVRPTWETVDGSETGRYVMEVTLSDRRVLWQYGAITGGPYNERTEDGKGIVSGTEKTLKELIQLCLTAMGETVDEIPDSAVTVHDVEWAVDNPAEALQQLLDAGNLLIALRTDGKVDIYEKGKGSEPNIPEGMKEKTSPMTSDPVTPDGVLVTSAPSRVVNEVTIEGWVAVGEEADGEIKPIGSLSYKPSTGWKEVIAWEFDKPEESENFGLTDEQRKLAEKCVGKWFRMPLVGSGETNEKKLPILEQIVMTKDGKRLPPLVEAATFRTDASGRWKNFAKGLVSEGYAIDYRRGIVQFSHPVGQVTTVNECFLHKAGIASWGPVDVLFAYEKREGTEDDFYRYPDDLGTGDSVQVVRNPELVLYQVEGLNQNKDKLDTIAEKQAAAIAGETGPMEVREQRCKGCHDVRLNGKVMRVTWDGNLTTYTVNDSLPTGDATSLQEKEIAARIQVGRSASDGHRRTEAIGTGIGSGKRARSGGGSPSIIQPFSPRQANLWKKTEGDDEGPFKAVRILQDGTEVGEEIEDVYPADADIQDDVRGWIGQDADGKPLFFCSQTATFETFPIEHWVKIQVGTSGSIPDGFIVRKDGDGTEDQMFFGREDEPDAEDPRWQHPISIVGALAFNYVDMIAGGETLSARFSLGYIRQAWDPATITWLNRPIVFEPSASYFQVVFSGDIWLCSFRLGMGFPAPQSCFGLRVRVSHISPDVSSACASVGLTGLFW